MKINKRIKIKKNKNKKDKREKDGLTVSWCWCSWFDEGRGMGRRKVFYSGFWRFMRLKSKGYIVVMRDGALMRMVFFLRWTQERREKREEKKNKNIKKKKKKLTKKKYI